MTIHELNDLLTQYSNIDFRLVEPSKGHPKDHEYVRSLGYKISMGSDCSYSCGINGLSLSSYGDWGTIYDWCPANGRSIFVSMINKNIIKIFRYGSVKKNSIDRNLPDGFKHYIINLKLGKKFVSKDQYDDIEYRIKSWSGKLSDSAEVEVMHQDRMWTETWDDMKSILNDFVSGTYKFI